MQMISILEAIRNMFVKSGQMCTPCVYFHPSCAGPRVAQLADAVRGLKGRVATDPSEMGVTHWVYPFPAAGDPDDGEVR